MSVPLGHRNGKSRREWIDPVKRITKTAVDNIINAGRFECLYSGGNEPGLKPYNASSEDLHRILHDGKTKVKIAGSRTDGYALFQQTVVMEAPSINATIYIRTPIT